MVLLLYTALSLRTDIIDLRREKYHSPLLVLAEHFPDGPPAVGVHARSRLIEKKELWLPNQRASEAELTLHSAGQCS